MTNVCFSWQALLGLAKFTVDDSALSKDSIDPSSFSKGLGESRDVTVQFAIVPVAIINATFYSS